MMAANVSYTCPYVSSIDFNQTRPLGIHQIRYFDLATYPFFLIACTVGNILNTVVLIRDHEGANGSKNAYLLGIAVTDVIYMWTAILSYIKNYDGEIHGRPRPFIQADIARISGIGYFLQETSAVVSSWLIVGFTVKRFVAIKYPLRHLVYSSTRRSWTIIASIVLLACALTSYRIVDYYWFFSNYSGRGPPPVRPPHLLQWNKFFTWTMIAIQISTFLTICILNLSLLHVLSEQQKAQQKDLQEFTATLEREALPAPRLEKGPVILLNACVLLYLVTHGPVFLYNLLHILEKSCIRQMSPYFKLICMSLNNIALNTYFSSNFFVYCGADKRFRARLLSIQRPYVYRFARRLGSACGSVYGSITMLNRVHSTPDEQRQSTPRRRLATWSGALEKKDSGTGSTTSALLMAPCAPGQGSKKSSLTNSLSTPVIFEHDHESEF